MQWKDCFSFFSFLRHLYKRLVLDNFSYIQAKPGTSLKFFLKLSLHFPSEFIHTQKNLHNSIFINRGLLFKPTSQGFGSGSASGSGRIRCFWMDPDPVFKGDVSFFTLLHYPLWRPHFFFLSKWPLNTIFYTPMARDWKKKKIFFWKFS